MSDEKVYVFIPERKSEEVIVLLNQISDLKRRLEFADIHIDELKFCINKLVEGLGKKTTIRINDVENNEVREFQVQSAEVIRV